MFDLGIQELIVIFIVALIVFGPKRLPDLGRALGKGISELKKALEGVKEQMDAEFKTEQKLPESNHPEPVEKKNGDAKVENPVKTEKEIR